MSDLGAQQTVRNSVGIRSRSCCQRQESQWICFQRTGDPFDDFQCRITSTTLKFAYVAV